MLRKKFIKRLGHESLEKRLMLAGDVTVKVSGGALTITGDANPNNIFISGTGVAGKFQVFGNPDFAVGLPTTINGGAGPVTVTGVTGDVNINLRAGDDTLALDNAVFPGNLIIGDDGGTNGYNLGVNSILIAKDMTMNVSGNNDISETVCLTSGNHNIFGGAGIDTIVIENSSTAKNETISTGGGQDIISTINVYVRGALLEDVGSGDDLISGIMTNVGGSASFIGGTGQDTIALNACGFGGNMTVDSGDGIDFVSLVNVKVFASQTTILTGSGADNIAISGVTAHNVTLDSGADNDTATITTSRADSLFAIFGDGNDSLSATSDTITGTATLDGGSGTDTLTNGGLNTFGKLNLISFP